MSWEDVLTGMKEIELKQSLLSFAVHVTNSLDKTVFSLFFSILSKILVMLVYYLLVWFLKGLRESERLGN
jgi:hypothetical protein